MFGYQYSNNVLLKKICNRYLEITDKKIIDFYDDVLNGSPVYEKKVTCFLYSDFFEVFKELYIKLNEILGEENVDALNDHIILKMPTVFYEDGDIKYPRTVHFILLNFFDYSFYYYNLTRTYNHEEDDQHWVHASLPKSSNTGMILPVVCRGEGVVAMLHNDIITEFTEILTEYEKTKTIVNEKINNLAEKIELFVVQQTIGLQKQQGTSFFYYNIKKENNKINRIIPDEVKDGTYLIQNEDSTYSIYNPIDDSISLKETLFTYINSPYKIYTKNIKVNLSDGTSKTLCIVTEFSVNLKETFSFKVAPVHSMLSLLERKTVTKISEKLKYEVSRTYNLLNNTYDFSIKNEIIKVLLKETFTEQKTELIHLKDIECEPFRDILAIPAGPYTAYYVRQNLPTNYFLYKGNLYKIKRQNNSIEKYNSCSLTTLLDSF